LQKLHFARAGTTSSDKKRSIRDTEENCPFATIKFDANVKPEPACKTWRIVIFLRRIHQEDCLWEKEEQRKNRTRTLRYKIEDIGNSILTHRLSELIENESFDELEELIQRFEENEKIIAEAKGYNDPELLKQIFEYLIQGRVIQARQHLLTLEEDKETSILLEKAKNIDDEKIKKIILDLIEKKEFEKAKKRIKERLSFQKRRDQAQELLNLAKKQQELDLKDSKKSKITKELLQEIEELFKMKPRDFKRSYYALKKKLEDIIS